MTGSTRPAPPAAEATLEVWRDWIMRELMTGDYGPDRTEVTSIDGITPTTRRLTVTLNRRDPEYAHWLTRASGEQIVVEDRPLVVIPIDGPQH